MDITSEPASFLEPRDAEREPDPNTTSAKREEEDLVVEDLLIEDVSIDGMCGVY